LAKSARWAVAYGVPTAAALLERQALVERPDARLGDDAQLGVGAAAADDVDTVARLHPRYAVSDRDDLAGAVAAGREGQLRLAGVVAAAHVGLDRIDAGGADADENLTRARLRVRHLLDLHHLGLTELAHQDGPHRIPLMFKDTLVDEFTLQAETFNASRAMSSEETLHSLLTLLPLSPDQRWLDVACGPGLVARAMAPKVASVVGVDVTPAMVELARAEAAAAGLANVEFRLGDVGRLDLPDDAFDGAICRFAFHHIPVPGRVLAEMARVVRPGGWVVVSDHVSDAETDLAAWHEEIERLRDPSHWDCLTIARRRAMGERLGLALVDERLQPNLLDYEDWIARGSTGPANRALIDLAMAERPEGTPTFSLAPAGDGPRQLRMVIHIMVWQVRPGAP
jgi:SAM-dependent methyltransferase